MKYELFTPKMHIMCNNIVDSKIIRTLSIHFPEYLEVMRDELWEYLEDLGTYIVPNELDVLHYILREMNVPTFIEFWKKYRIDNNIKGRA